MTLEEAEKIARALYVIDSDCRDELCDELSETLPGFDWDSLISAANPIPQSVLDANADAASAEFDANHPRDEESE